MNNNSPHYAVIFSSQTTEIEKSEYMEVAERMVALASHQEGFMGMENIQNEQGFSIMISYWDSLTAIKQWKKNTDHYAARKKGRESWYKTFTVSICKIEHMYHFASDGDDNKSQVI
ncbi:heme-degrading monooxygenase HmoA [Pullulanibacillus pueri]|uniref:Antibiotic biosynthesis monooxygenase n=1 Tax=Pullulanibacillus pueri TaxID=1437324 RepID=A0A8J3ENM1_9BACL|nr:antibiotic biosynthesis monooxygenase [Pullulanibacillus pueri]MBM7680554.1 heme-degrading monooxygenase HmoA [Pullulanibacillus pueri]GGH88412.1 antibiotic biosynthesis monooxygenase [Pullulanibacillus pueri]